MHTPEWEANKDKTVAIDIPLDLDAKLSDIFLTGLPNEEKKTPDIVSTGWCDKLKTKVSPKIIIGKQIKPLHQEEIYMGDKTSTDVASTVNKQKKATTKKKAKEFINDSKD